MTSQPAAPDLASAWNGSLEAGALKLRIVFHVTREASGEYAATLDSPDQTAYGIRVSGIHVDGNKVRLEIQGAGAYFEGTLDSTGNELEGTWNQSGNHLPLILRRGELEAARRPQTPAEPYPYVVRDVTVENKTDGVQLSGTLTLPPGDGPFAAAVLISGSGQQNRNEEIFQHKPFLVLADHLTRSGIAVLRYDDRGVGGSTGNPATATSRDFSRDALAVAEYLRAVPGVDPGRVGLIGHSEGGLIATMLAASTPEIAFVVLLAGPGLPGDELLLLQSAALIRAGGGTEQLVDQATAANRLAYDVVKTEPDPVKAKTRLVDVLRAAGVPEEQVEGHAESLLTPWFRFFLTYDPRPDLRRLRQPVLALIGTKDLQVPAEQDLAALREALSVAGNPKSRVESLEGLNHLFQTATTGLPTEYGAIEETMAPVVLKTVADWILSL